MSAEAAVRKLIEDFCAENKGKDYDDDELFDLQSELAEAIRVNEFPELVFDKDDDLDTCIFGIIESYIADVSDDINPKQNKTKTGIMVKNVLERGRRAFSRIKPRDENG